MGISIKDGKLIYHLTALANIESILINGLKPRKELTETFKDIAEKDIIDFRNTNNISNLIPFHFFTGTPFAGAVQKNYPDIEFVYIALHRDIAKDPKKNFKIIPTHPKHMKPLKMFKYKEGLKEIDWELMEKRDYTDSECKEACMAECVAGYKHISPKIFHCIIVKSKETKSYIEKLCQKIYKTNCKQTFFIDVEKKRFVGP